MPWQSFLGIIWSIFAIQFWTEFKG